MLFPTAIDSRIRKFVGKTVSSIATKLYDIIENRAHELNIYTYEIDYRSKAFKIFIEKEYLFNNEKILQKEILIHLLHSKGKDAFFHLIKQIEPLPLENHGTNDYVKFLLDFHKKRSLLGELIYIYEENKLGKERLDIVELIGDDISFDNSEDEEY